MKKSDLIILWFFTGLLVLFSNPIYSADDNPIAQDLVLFSKPIYRVDNNSIDQDPVTKIKERIQRIDKKLGRDFQVIHNLTYNQVIIALGVTGSGKSTLINFLANKCLVVHREPGQWIIDVTEPLDGIVPGYGDSSKTTEPSYWYDADSQTIYYDSPGFMDTRNES